MLAYFRQDLKYLYASIQNVAINEMKSNVKNEPGSIGLN
jgi:hypothetical protein